MADNAGNRVLSARKTLRGQRDALENILSQGLHDGACCYVLEEQANYRYVATSSLPADDRYVVMPVGQKGRFVRETGLVGFAILDDGEPRRCDRGEYNHLVFANYRASQVVQFEVTADGDALYVGSVPRLAIVSGGAQLGFESGSADLYIGKVNEVVHLASMTIAGVRGLASVSSLLPLMPGDRVFLGVGCSGAVGGHGSLRILLT